MNDDHQVDRHYSNIIVGGGSAGAVLASRLSEDPNRSVLLIEAGPDFPAGDYPADLLAGRVASVEPYRTWGYASAPDTNGHSIQAWAGKVIGGGSAINGAVSRRARPADFARWEGRGLPEWSWDQVLPAYRSLENTLDGDDRWHGRSGLWPVRQSVLGDLSKSVRTYVEAAMAAGYRSVSDFNDPEHHGGAGAEATNIVDGVRYNTALTHLDATVRARPNLTILADTLADRVRFDGGRAVAIRLADGREIAGGEIILSAGTFGSAAILLRSGIGPAAHLSAIGIDVIVDLPVGLNLQDQPMYVMGFPLKPDPGVTSTEGSGIVWLSSSLAGDGDLDQQLSISVQPGFDPEGRPMDVLSVWSCLVSPRSAGTVRLKATDPRCTPAIDFRLLTESGDRVRLRELVRLAGRLARDNSVAALLLGGIDAEPTTTALDAQIDRGLTTFVHATSTAPMGGPDDPHAVVDAWGRVKSVNGLRIVDASIFPTAVSVPTNLTVIMVAERIAARINGEGADV